MKDGEIIGKVHSSMYHQCKQRGYATPVDVLMDRAYLSLDRGDGIERHAVSISLSPEAIYEEKTLHAKLHMAFCSLSEKQTKRIFEHFFLDMSKAEIARAEGVSRETVGESIRRGLHKMETFLKNSEK